MCLLLVDQDEVSAGVVRSQDELSERPVFLGVGWDHERRMQVAELGGPLRTYQLEDLGLGGVEYVQAPGAQVEHSPARIIDNDFEAGLGRLFPAVTAPAGKLARDVTVTRRGNCPVANGFSGTPTTPSPTRQSARWDGVNRDQGDPLIVRETVHGNRWTESLQRWVEHMEPVLVVDGEEVTVRQHAQRRWMVIEQCVTQGRAIGRVTAEHVLPGAKGRGRAERAAVIHPGED